MNGNALDSQCKFFCALRRTDSPVRQKFALLISKRNFGDSKFPGFSDYRHRLVDFRRSSAVPSCLAPSAKRPSRLAKAAYRHAPYAETFVKTFKRDFVQVAPIPGRRCCLTLFDSWMGDYRLVIAHPGSPYPNPSRVGFDGSTPLARTSSWSGRVTRAQFRVP
jgi:hypothetical protein